MVLNLINQLENFFQFSTGGTKCSSVDESFAKNTMSAEIDILSELDFPCSVPWIVLEGNINRSSSLVSNTTLLEFKISRFLKIKVLCF